MRRTRATCGALVALLMSSQARAERGDHIEEPYVPPPPEEVPEQHGAFWKVAPKDRHEIWLVDQSNSAGRTHGGTLYIYEDQALRRDAGKAEPEVVDLGAATTERCQADTGAAPVRPHMLVFNRTGTHAALAFVASGHVVIFDAHARSPVRCLRTEVGADGARQAHAVWPAPDDSHLLVANQNGKKLERIRTDYAHNTFTQEPEATLDLAGCTTPSGSPCQAPSLRPDNAPICPFIPDTGFPAYLSLRGGGMLVVDPRTAPMRIIAEYDAANVPRDGCGFVQAAGWVYGNGGGGNAAHKDGWFLYRLPVGGADLYRPRALPNQPATQAVSQDHRVPRDAHGSAKSRGGQYVYFFDRAANVVEIYAAAAARLLKTESLVSAASADPTPDLVAESPDGKYLYASTRGPNPLSGDPHASTGSTPGLLVLELLEGGRDLAVRGLALIHNRDEGGIERADGHGINVRRVSGPPH